MNHCYFKKKKFQFQKENKQQGEQKLCASKIEYNQRSTENVKRKEQNIEPIFLAIQQTKSQQSNR